MIYYWSIGVLEYWSVGVLDEKSGKGVSRL